MFVETKKYFDVMVDYSLGSIGEFTANTFLLLNLEGGYVEIDTAPCLPLSSIKSLQIDFFKIILACS